MQSLTQRNKKGLELGESIPAILIVTVLFILVIVMVYMISSLQGTFTGLLTQTVTEETLTGQNLSTGAVLKNSTATHCNWVLSTIAIKNLTGTIPSTNYTVNTDGVVRNTSSPYSNNIWNATYTFTHGGDSCKNARTLNNTITNNIGVVGLVMTVIFIAILIAVLIGTMMRKNSL